MFAAQCYGELNHDVKSFYCIVVHYGRQMYNIMSENVLVVLRHSNILFVRSGDENESEISLLFLLVLFFSREAQMSSTCTVAAPTL